MKISNKSNNISNNKAPKRKNSLLTGFGIKDDLDDDEESDYVETVDITFQTPRENNFDINKINTGLTLNLEEINF